MSVVADILLREKGVFAWMELPLPFPRWLRAYEAVKVAGHSHFVSCDPIRMGYACFCQIC